MASKEEIKAVAYLRTSKSEIGDQLFDLHMQEQHILEFAKDNAHTIKKSFGDFGGEKKPVLYDVLDYCRHNKEITVAIAKNHTRISRNIQDFHQWEAMFKALGVELKFVEQSVINDSRKFLNNLMTETAKIESANRSAFIEKGFLRRVQAGYSVQKPPRGYTRTLERGLFAKDTNTAGQLYNSISQFLTGILSYEELRHAVSLIFLKDKTFTHDKFRKMITNPYYAGYITYNGIRYRGLHEPLLTEAEYKQLTTLLSK